MNIFWPREASPSNVKDLFEFLVAEHDYPGSLRNSQCYVKEAFPAPPFRAGRRVETPPGAKAQIDWAHFPSMMVAGQRRDSCAFSLQLCFSRADVLAWSESAGRPVWLGVHDEGFARLGGVPAMMRVDNAKTTVSHGAGTLGMIKAAYGRFAWVARFRVNACQPRSPDAKGKVERRILDYRDGSSPHGRHWKDVARVSDCLCIGWVGKDLLLVDFRIAFRDSPPSLTLNWSPVVN